MADIFLLHPNSLEDRMLQSSAASAIWEARNFSKHLPMHDSSDIGRRLFGDPRSVLPGLGMGTHLATFHCGGKAPCLKRFVKRSAIVCLFPMAAASIIPYDMLSGPVA